jgi:hypothetical protein
LQDFSAAFIQILQQLGAALQKQQKPISTLALLNALRQHKQCAASKILAHSGLLELPLPPQQDEGDAGIFSKSMERAMISAEDNLIAWIYFKVGQFNKADQLSAQSVRAIPTVSSALGTRGEVLAALGEFAAGKELLWRAVRTTRCPESAALNLHALTRLAALEADEPEFLRLNSLILDLDPQVERYPTSSAARESARIRGHSLTPKPAPPGGGSSPPPANFQTQ